MYVKSFCGKPALRLTLADTNLETGAYVSQVNHKTLTFRVKGVLLVPSGYTLEGFAICALCLATMAILYLDALHKTK